jgi:hypothetical protein
MALDALEMAFTHDHINAFVIVGGDSDFISLVEKLKQYGRKVIVVGGRQFTSVTMQRNCHEFIAYENLMGSRSTGRSAERGGRPAAAAGDIAKALPIVKRALKVLSDREVTPQLGLLKSTLLQLDSTFSEREYGASSFRDFMEKVAAAGAVTLKHAGRSMLVEPVEDGQGDAPETAPPAPAAEAAPPPAEAARPADVDADEEQLPPSPMSLQDGIRDVQRAFTQAASPPRWPMYVRQAKQYLRNAIDGFDERKYGFASVVDLLRAAGKEGVLRIERDRQGAVRIFPGANLNPRPAMPVDEPMDVEEIDTEAAGESTPEPVAPVETMYAEPVADAPIVDGETIAPDDEPAEEVAAAPEPQADQPAAERAPARKRKAAAPRASKTARTTRTARPRARKSTRS